MGEPWPLIFTLSLVQLDLCSATNWSPVCAHIPNQQTTTTTTKNNHCTSDKISESAGQAFTHISHVII